MDYRVAIIGMGYVGLPLAVEAGKYYDTIGFDIDKDRIRALRAGYDATQEVEPEALRAAEGLRFSAETSSLKGCNFFIITTPTPLDEAKKPDLRHLISATRTVGQVLLAGGYVVYESTVYPGCTEEVCVPVLEEESGLCYNKGFFCGYSPERINPGDKTRRITDIHKITSGSTDTAARQIDTFYRRLIPAGTHCTSSIRVAEAAKAIENAQRDINIAFVNELSMMFHKMELDTQEVLEAAGTKWNFLPFKPGLVGGRCIGVDPYYLTYKSENIGHHAQIILSGRRLNDDMGAYVASRLVKLLSRSKQSVVGAKVLLLGLTFKENCPDTRNSKVFDLIEELQSYGIEVMVYDPWADKELLEAQHNLILLQNPYAKSYEAVVLTVAHSRFCDLDWQLLKGKQTVLLDLKGIVPRRYADERL